MSWIRIGKKKKKLEHQRKAEWKEGIPMAFRDTVD